MAKRTEQEIMKDWNYSDKPLVSVCCITYNHELYIRDAIEGFLMQETSFPFEVIIHDDASKDHTADIIREYATKYPRIIKPIFQEENQYSQGIKISPTFVWPKARGKYIALCEGDDYWVKSYKLQKQAEYMERHFECSMCFHAAEVMDVRKKSSAGYIRLFNKTKVWPKNKLFLGGGHSCPTASIFFIKKYIDNLPAFFYESPVGDHALALLLSVYGDVVYIDEVMSNRNLWVTNSFNTQYHEEKSNEWKILHIEEMIKVLKDFNRFSKRRWEKDIKKNILSRKLIIFSLKGYKKPLKSEEINKLIGELDIKERLKFYLRWAIPELYFFMSKLKKYLGSVRYFE